LFWDSLAAERVDTEAGYVASCDNGLNVEGEISIPPVLLIISFLVEQIAHTFLSPPYHIIAIFKL
jgi:hypothetical protein